MRVVIAVIDSFRVFETEFRSNLVNSKRAESGFNMRHTFVRIPGLNADFRTQCSDIRVLAKFLTELGQGLRGKIRIIILNIEFDALDLCLKLQLVAVRKRRASLIRCGTVTSLFP